MTRRRTAPGDSRHLASLVARELNLSLDLALAHADALLNRIDRGAPDLDAVIASLLAIQDAGRNAAELVRSVRSDLAAAPG